MPSNPTWDETEALPTWDDTSPLDETDSDWLGIGQEVSGVGRALHRGVLRADQSATLLGQQANVAGIDAQASEAKRISDSLNEFYRTAQANPAFAQAPASQRWQAEQEGRLSSLVQEINRRAPMVPEAIKRVARREAQVAGIPTSPDLQNLQTDFWRTLRDNPFETIATVAAESLPQSITGTAIGAATAGPVGIVVGTGANSFGVEYANTILDTARSQGVDVSNPEQLTAFLNDPERMSLARRRGLLRGVPIAAFDAASAGLAGRFLRPVLKPALEAGQKVAVKPVITATAKELAAEGGLGGLGETGGQLAVSGKVTSLPDIVLETIAGTGTTFVEAPANILTARTPSVPSYEDTTPVEPPTEDAQAFSDALDRRVAALDAALQPAVTPTEGVQDAIQEQEPSPQVLRTETPQPAQQLGLQEVAAEVRPTEEETVSLPPTPSGQRITPEQYLALTDAEKAALFQPTQEGGVASEEEIPVQETQEEVTPVSTGGAQTPPTTLAQAFSQYDETGEIETVADLVNTVEGLVAEGKGTAKLQKAIDRYRADAEEDIREFGGRGDADEYEQRFLDALENAVASEAKKAKPQKPAPTGGAVATVPPRPASEGTQRPGFMARPSVQPPVKNQSTLPKRFRERIDREKKERAEFKARILQQVGDATAVTLQADDGRNYIVSPSAQEPGRWQLTWFTLQGEPSGHTTFNTRDDAISSAIGIYGKSGPPIGDATKVLETKKTRTVADKSKTPKQQEAAESKASLIQRFEEALTQAPEDFEEGVPKTIVIESGGTQYRLANTKKSIQNTLDRLRKVRTTSTERVKIGRDSIAAAQRTKLSNEFIVGDQDEIDNTDVARARIHLEQFEAAVEGRTEDQELPITRTPTRNESDAQKFRNTFLGSLQAAMGGPLPGQFRTGVTVGTARQWLKSRLNQLVKLADGNRAIAAIESLEKKIGEGTYSDPLLLTPLAKLALKIAKQLIRGGMALERAIREAIAQARAQTPDAKDDDAKLGDAMRGALEATSKTPQQILDEIKSKLPAHIKAEVADVKIKTSVFPSNLEGSGGLLRGRTIFLEEGEPVNEDLILHELLHAYVLNHPELYDSNQYQGMEKAVDALQAQLAAQSSTGPSGQTFTGPTRERDKTSKGQSSFYQSEGPARSETEDEKLASEQVSAFGDDLDRAYSEAQKINEPAFRQVVLAEILARTMDRLEKSNLHDVAMRNLAARLSETFKAEGREAGQALQSRVQANEKLDPYKPLLSWLNLLRTQFEDQVRKPLGPKVGQIEEGIDKAARKAVKKKTPKEREAEFDKELDKELEQAGIDKPTREKIRSKKKKLLDVLNDPNATDEDILRVLGEAFGLETEDGPTAKKLLDLTKKAKKAPEGLPRHKVIQEMMDLVFDKAPVDWHKLIQDIWFGSVLMRLGTFLNVAVGSSTTSVMNLGLQMLDRAARGGDVKGAARIMHQYLVGLLEGARVGVHIARTGDYSVLPDFQDRADRFFRGQMKPDQLEAMLRKQSLAKHYPGKLAYTRRIMTALDYIFATATRDSSVLYSALTRNDQESVDKLARKWDKTATRLADEQARNELGEDADAAEIAVRRRQILEEGVAEEEKAAAAHLARRVAGNADPQGVPGLLYGFVQAGANWIDQQVPGAGFVTKVITGTPFLRASMNMMQNAMDLFPGVGIVKATLGTGRAPIKLLQRDIFKTTPEEQRMQVVGSLVGMAATVGLGSLVLLDKDEEKDRKFDVTGSWSGFTQQQKKQMMDAGMRPYSFGVVQKDGTTKWISYRQSPLIGIFATIGYLRDHQRKDPQEYEATPKAEWVVGAGISGALAIKDFSALSGLASIFNYSAQGVDDPKDLAEKTSRFLSQAVGRPVSGFIPSVVKELDEFLDPTLYRENGDKITGYWLRNIPLARRTVGEGPDLNIFGEPVKQTRPPLRAYLSSQDSNEPAWRALSHALNNGVFPTYVSETAMVTDGGQRRRMTEPEFYRYREAFGKLMKQRLSADAGNLLKLDRPRLEQYFDGRGAIWGSMRVTARQQAFSKK